MEKVIKVIFILLKSSTHVTLMLLSLSVLLKSSCCTVDFVTGMENQCSNKVAQFRNIVHWQYILHSPHF